MSETPGFFKFYPEAKIPQRATPQSAGFDLYTSMDAKITTSVAIPTGVGIIIPEGYYARIAPRSGLALRGLAVNAGVIDRDYTGEIKVILYSLNLEYDYGGASSIAKFKIKKGDKIAQLILEKISYQDMSEVPMPETKSYHSGFGSTG
jgi:deoxyuridine 5'-triphosphate nucleotidohydrolase